jgi:CubicO group peptidase (beta-lactamase class C family)
MGFSISAAVIEQVSGQAWEDYLRDRIWQPFGMTQTGWTFPTEPPDGLAAGYLDGISQGIISDRIAALDGADWNLKGNGGLQASAADMQRFYQGLMGESQAVRELILKPQAPGEDVGVREGYGLFFRLDENDQVYRVGHSGSDGVFFSYFAFYPQHKAFFYMVGNNGEDLVIAELRSALKTLEAELGIGAAAKPENKAP